MIKAKILKKGDVAYMSMPDLYWVEEAKTLNSKLFSLPRILILLSLSALQKKESATYRELKSAIGLSDGVLFANLKVLKDMGYIKEEKVKVDNETMTSYFVTSLAKEDLKKMFSWVRNVSGESNG